MKKFWSKNIAFLLLAFIKLFFMFFFINHLKDDNTSCFIKLPENEIGSDDEGYFSTVDNLIETGEYFYEGVNSGYKMYAPRVPGVSITYLLFRAVFSKNIAINCLIFLQLALFLLAVFLLQKITFANVRAKKPKYILFIIFGLDAYLSFYNNIPYLAESFTVSLIMITIYNTNKFFVKKQKKYLFFSGIFASISFFFKVSNIVFVTSCLVYLGYFLLKTKTTFKKVIIHYLIFISPFILLEAAWITRNYVKTDRIIILQEIASEASTDIMKPSKNIFISCVNFCKSFGGDIVRWNPNSAMSWFSTEEYLNHMNFKRPSLEVFPKHIQFDIKKTEQLKLAREAWWNLQDEFITISEREKAIEEAINIFNSLKKDIYLNHPFLFYVKSRLLFSFNLLYESSTYYFPYTFAKANIFEKLIKITASVIYYIVMILPFLFFPFYIFKYRQLNNHLINFSYLTSLSYMFLYCFLFRTSEFRYNHTVYFFFVIISGFVFLRLIQYFYSLRIKTNNFKDF